MTRRTRGMVDGFDLVELVDVDPTVFGSGHEIVGSRFDGPEAVPHREGAIAGGRASAWRLGLVVLLLVSTAAVTAGRLRPWYRNPALLVRSTPVTPSLTDQLVIGRYPGVARSAEISSVTTGSASGEVGGAVFAAFTEDGVDPAHSAAYSVVANDDTVSPGGEVEPVTVHGALGTLQSHGSTVLVQWHPADHTTATLRTSGMDRAAALRLAGELSLRGDAVRVGHRGALRGMQPVGTIDDARQLSAVFQAAQSYAGQATFGPRGASSRIVAVRYSAAVVAVGTSTSADMHRLIELFFPGAAHTTADGYDAVVVDTTTSDGSVTVPRTTVVWTEGGRILAVSAPTRALAEKYAEAVRPASAGEWDEVQHLSAPSAGRAGGGSARVV